MTTHPVIETSASRRLSIVILLWTLIGCMIPNVWLSMVERMPLLPSLTNILLPAGLYLWLMSRTRRIGRATLWMTILFIFAAFQMVLLYMYGRSVIAVDMFLNVVTTNPGEVGELLGNMMIIIITVVCIFLPPIIMAIIAVLRRYRLPERAFRLTRRASHYALIAGAILFVLSFFGSRPFRPHCDIYPLNIAYNLEVAVHRTIKVSNYHETSASFRYDASSTHPDSVPELYLLVIGETSRADNWQLDGYDRPTTPRLINLDGLTSFPRAISQSNTTHKSVPMLLSPLDAASFGDSIYCVKSLVTAFKEAGFHTAFYTAHSRNHSFIDFFGEEADTCIFVKEQGQDKAHYYDSDLLPYLDRQLAAGNRKQLIVLHTYGSHFNYIDRYPESQAHFTPDRPSEATYHFRDKQVNAYDNTILFTSNFLADVIDRLRSHGGYSAMIYTSDHGEDIFDDSRHLFLHASPIPSYYQLHVPFLVWLSPDFAAVHGPEAAALRANSGKFVATSDALFHTLLDLAGLRTPWLHTSSSVASPAYRERPAIYLNDHNDAVALRNCGILAPDFQKLDSLQIPLK